MQDENAVSGEPHAAGNALRRDAAMADNGRRRRIDCRHQSIMGYDNALGISGTPGGIGQQRGSLRQIRMFVFGGRVVEQAKP